MKTPNSLFDIEQYRITSLTPVEPHKFLYKWEETPFLPRKELVAITGKAKSGKSFFESILMALCVRKQPLLNISRAEEKPYRALWIDTEQSEDTTKEILCERIDRMAYSGELNYDGISVDEMICTYNIRNVQWKNRFAIVSSAVLTVKPDIVFLDGIRDLVNDINDGSMAQHLVERLMSLADYANCCIVCVLHQNKAAEDKTLRGALGTELTNKAFETYELCKDKETRVFSVQQTATRKYDITGKLQFCVSSAGLPQWCYTPEENNYLLPNGNIDVQRIFPDILSSKTRMRSYELKGHILEVTGLSADKSNRAVAAISEALRKGIIQRDAVSDQEVYYQLPNQPAGFQPV